MEGESDLDVDSLRMAHENDVEWGLRRTFLAAHQDKFQKNRLLCLASCFVNVEIYGNRYPDEVMRQLKELMDDIKEETAEFRETLQERSKVKFVKSSNSSSGPPQPSKERGAMPVCRNYLAGRCRFGDRCNFIHEQQ